ncbi:MAG: penicillin-binding protein 1C [Deltaproteobacteria bacterium]|nr:penicillin-binding protein 1C [Deltaproteobacteria bacterium]
MPPDVAARRSPQRSLPRALSQSKGRGAQRAEGQARRSRLLSRLRTAALIAGFSLLALLGLAVVAVEGASYFVELPAGLERREDSLRILDRHGALLREVRSGKETKARWIPLDRMSPHVLAATLAAEDRRFWEHGGVDVLAVGRAVVQDVLAGEVVSGASTITMQLAKLLRGGGRTLGNKFLEAALARKLERTFDKRRILEEYLNRLPYGNDLEGIEAASWGYFRKSAHDLSLGEAAALAALPRSPTLYDPYRQASQLRARRDRVLDRMLAAGAITAAERRRAVAEPLDVHPPLRRFEAPHFVQWILAGGGTGEVARKDSGATGPAAPATGFLRTTLDLDLQRRVETLVERTARELRPRGGEDAAVIVLENATGEVLAYVGSADFFDPDAGQVDGVRALRQPGSALKPLVYALAFRSGYSPASVLPDVATRFPAGDGDWFEPRNYDNRFHGPVRAREALANSFNVPAVYLAQALTPGKLLDTFHDFGLVMLDRPADHYGVAIALGDGEVTLLALANAYATLARGGIFLPVRALRDVPRAAGSPGCACEPSSPSASSSSPPICVHLCSSVVSFSSASPVRVVSSPVAWLVTDILADRRARLAAFGEGNVLELPFRVAAKTGTSKNYRDNWTVGYTREVTVGVWVGNFSGAPMGSVSGITGAGPLFREVMLAAMEGRTAEEWVPPTGVRRIRVCALSGELAGPDCPHMVEEWASDESLALRPVPVCSYHRAMSVDVRTGLLAGPGCPAEDVVRRVFESYPPGFAEWAHDAARPLPPAGYSPLCPAAEDFGGGPDVAGEPGCGPVASASAGSCASAGTSGGAPAPAVVLTSPPDGAHYSIDPDVRRELQTVELRAQVRNAGEGTAVRFYVDDRLVAESRAPFRASWPLEEGTHRISARSGDAADGVVIHVQP